MVKVWLVKCPGGILGFRVQGHAGFGEYGKDIVCAGVSAITQTAVLGLRELLGQNRVFCEMRPGYLEVNLSREDAEKEGPSAVLKSLELGLQAIKESYPGSICLKYEQCV